MYVMEYRSCCIVLVNKSVCDSEEFKFELNELEIAMDKLNELNKEVFL